MPDDYVKRSDVHRAFQPKYAPAINRVFATMIDSVPAADVAAVRHGRWIKFSRGDVCSECQYQTGRYEHGGNYCPNCGAKMDLPEPPKEEKQ